MCKKLILLSIVLFLSAGAYSQALTGTIYYREAEKELPVVGAAVAWIGGASATMTGENGRFDLPFEDSAFDEIIIQAFGFEQDTVPVNGPGPVRIELKRTWGSVDSVVIEGSPTFMSKSNIRQTEVVGKDELQRAACCNLSESFETNPTVDVNFTDALTGAKQIRMMGLEGAYSQMLQENMPALRGLSGSYGLSFIPGTWISSIQVSKGAGSVVNGYESITGQINLEYIKPTDEYKYFLNLYGDAMGRAEGNFHYTGQVNKKLGTSLLLHGSGVFMKNERNNDGFLDVPLQRQGNFLNRWIYHSGKRLEAQFGVSGMVQERFGGQVGFDPKSPRDTSAYGIGVSINRFEAFGKLGILYPEKPYQSIGNMASLTYHRQHAFFGLRNYQGEQTSLYANSIFQTIIKHTGHIIKMGGSFLWDNYNEQFMNDTFLREEVVPGIFSEYTYTYLEKFSFVAGLRLDYHNFFGSMVSPRLHARYQAGKHVVLRVAGGKGYRTPNPLVEHAAVWASSRKAFIDPIQQEEAWNFGGSILRDIMIKNREGYILVDFYRTQFVNQFIADLDQHPQEVHLYNVRNGSYANSAQAETSFFPFEDFHIKVAYRYHDVKVTYHDT
ncbi:MAG: TonB-dependent receptor, partial [Bacteroidota bacterium]|nr:TonB-dependent receptor [Bacteroidota bacterium]